MGNTTGMTSFVCDHASVKWILSISGTVERYLKVVVRVPLVPGQLYYYFFKMETSISQCCGIRLLNYDRAIYTPLISGLLDLSDPDDAFAFILKGCGMGPWLVLVAPCFRENVVATCKIGSFLCSLDNLLQKNVIVLFLEIKFQNGAHLKKGLF